MRIKVLFVLVIVSMLLLPVAHSSQTPPYDLLIRNGRIVDGSGRAGYVADLAVKGDRIVTIGNLSQATAARVIDAQGLVVAPGFIDMLGQSETYLLIDPRAMSKVMMGVTTEITGEGESIAPINERQIKEQEDFLRRFNLTIDWRTLDEYFKRLEKQGSGVNLGTFVGATQVREYVIGYDDRAPNRAGVGADEEARRRCDARRRSRSFKFTAIRSGAFCKNRRIGRTRESRAPVRRHLRHSSTQ